MSACPILGCRTPIPSSMVMCRRHWFMAPKEIRDAVWNEYRLAPKSPAHYAAVCDAISAVMEQEVATP